MKDNVSSARETSYISIVYKDSANKLNDLTDFKEFASFD